MRLLEINSCCGCLSTGTIVSAIAKEYIDSGNEATVAYARSFHDTGIPTKKIGNKMDIIIHEFYTVLFDCHGLASKKATKDFLKWADEYNPDILWIHNIHGFYINYKLLFEWIKTRPFMKVKWTLHDCWAFTGHCTYFSLAGCNKWMTGCGHCPQKKVYPSSFLFDNSKHNYILKKQSFTGVKDMTIITPSVWLANLVKCSFLGNYNIEVVPNKIDTTVFHYRDSHVREKLKIENKVVLLGVASTWSERKGLYDYYQLSKMLGEKYAVVLVGLSKKQIANKPDNVIGLERTNTPIELAELYSAADIYVNLSKEETFGMTTIEALACETKVIVYKDTACEEVAIANGGMVVNQSLNAVYECVISLFGE